MLHAIVRMYDPGFMCILQHHVSITVQLPFQEDQCCCIASGSIEQVYRARKFCGVCTLILPPRPITTGPA